MDEFFVMLKKILLSALVILCVAAVSAQQKKIYFEADLLEYDEDLRDGAEQYMVVVEVELYAA